MMQKQKTEFILPNWPAPNNIKACTSTRPGGISQGNYSAFNLAHHVSDDMQAVNYNRQLLKEQLHCPAEPVWLQQVHGVHIVNAAMCGELAQADGSFSTSTNVVCAVLTADCLPVLICNKAGTKIAAAHAGWKGLQAGVIEAAIDALQEPADQLLVWLGPAIGADAFEVGADVKAAFENNLSEAAGAFRKKAADHWLADIYQLAKLKLNRAGVSAVFGGDYCTFTDSEKFYSYRRDGQTGRMASLIWRES